MNTHTYRITDTSGRIEYVVAGSFDTTLAIWHYRAQRAWGYTGVARNAYAQPSQITCVSKPTSAFQPIYKIGP